MAPARKRPRAAAPDGAPIALRLAIVGTREHDDLPARATLRRWVRRALLPATGRGRARGAPAARPARRAELALAFVDGRAGRRLNREFRARDYATNVLTFAYERAPALAADIVLCLPVVRREAREQGKTLRQHLAHLVIHGVLHAQGFDHESDREARVMQELERTLLAQLRIPDPYQSIEKTQ
jgi:probable rRNA maturation factor